VGGGLSKVTENGIDPLTGTIATSNAPAEVMAGVTLKATPLPSVARIPLTQSVPNVGRSDHAPPLLVAFQDLVVWHASIEAALAVDPAATGNESVPVAFAGSV
jgi:hypothetical protein